MRRTGSSEHFFTVRGRGFDDIQWMSIVSAAEDIVEHAKESGIKTSIEADALKLTIQPTGGGEALVIWKEGDPNAPRSVTTDGLFDEVVQSVLTATKKIAPMIFEMTCPDGRDYRRVLAGSSESHMPENSRLAASKSAIPLTDVDPKTRQALKKALPKFVLEDAFRAEASLGLGDDAVLLSGSLPGNFRYRFDGETLKRIAKISGLQWMEVFQNGAVFLVEKAIPKKSASSQETQQMTPSYDLLRKAAIRVAAKTENKALRSQLLDILRQAKEDDSDDDKDEGKEARHEEGKSVDIGDWLKENGFGDAAKKWEKHEGQIGNKSAASVVFPKVREMAWKRVVEFGRRNPKSRVASGSTANRWAAADALATKWIQETIQHPLASALLASHLKEK